MYMLYIYTIYCSYNATDDKKFNHFIPFFFREGEGGKSYNYGFKAFQSISGLIVAKLFCVIG